MSLQNPVSPHNLSPLLATPPRSSYIPVAFNSNTKVQQLAAISRISQPLGPDTNHNRLFSAFYQYFHPAHPFLLPHTQMRDISAKFRISHLELAIQYIGSLYVSDISTTIYLEKLQRSLGNGCIAQDGYLVQAYMLMAVGLHVSDEEEQSASAMQSAVSLAIELDMHRRHYATESGANSDVLAESWRRTWWELFVIDGLFAGSNPMYIPQLFEVVTDTYLPCEDSDVASGVREPRSPSSFLYCLLTHGDRFLCTSKR
jgi:hypothetical protein